MAMKRKPKPLRPDTTGTKAEVRGMLSTKPTVKVKPKGVLKKSAVKNPSAPKPVGSGASAGSVRVMTRSESGLKAGKAGSNRSSTPMNKNYKPSRGNQKLIESTQSVAKKGYIGLTAAEKREISGKGQKPKGGMTPPKKTPPAPKPKGRGRGGMGGGGLFGGGAIRKSR